MNHSVRGDTITMPLRVPLLANMPRTGPSRARFPVKYFYVSPPRYMQYSWAPGFSSGPRNSGIICIGRSFPRTRPRNKSDAGTTQEPCVIAIVSPRTLVIMQLRNRAALIYGRASYTWKTIVTMSFPMCLFLSSCCRLLGVKGNMVDTWKVTSAPRCVAATACVPVESVLVSRPAL